MLSIEKKTEGTGLSIVLAGRLDTITAPELEAELKDNLDGVAALTIDMAALEYISSAGLRVLLSARKILGSRGGLKVTGVNETIREIFDVTGFSDILTIE